MLFLPQDSVVPANQPNAPLVTLGMPIFNGERYLGETLDSIIAQSFSDWELVISDNASTDRTVEIIQHYAARDSRIRYELHNNNQGAAWNYNRVFALAKGKYFKWVAGDDLILPNMIEACVEVLENDPQTILAYPQTNIIDKDGKFSRHYDDKLDLRFARPSDRFRQFLYIVDECNAVFGLIRADALKQTKLIGNYIGSDLCLLAQLTLYGNFVEIQERLFLRREHPAASSCNKGVEDQLEFFDPKLKGKIVMTDWRHIRENLTSIMSSPISPKEKIRALGFLARFSVLIRDRLFGELRFAMKQLHYRLKHK